MKSNGSYGVLDPAIAIESMRSNGYISTDTALLELIDNSIDAGAETIDVFCFEIETTLSTGRQVPRVGRIGVLDDGSGMNTSELRRSLRFGGRSEEDRRRIGRFGFGLPNASISQCNLTRIWSWTSGHTNATSTYLNVEEVSSGIYDEVPDPQLTPLPDDLLNLVGEPATSGSYVEWSELGGRGTWKRGASVISHTSRLVGRVYRKYLQGNSPLQIVLHVVGPSGQVEESLAVIPNDPQFLMAPTSARWDNEPMFQPYVEHEFQIPDFDGFEHPVKVTISYSTPEAREIKNGQVAGNQPHGQDAVRNQGVSVVRNLRELELADVVTVDRYLDRWWGCEIAFPAELDDLFGVSNNKQGASNLTYYLRQLGKDERSLFEFGDTDDVDRGEPLGELIYMAQWIHETLRDVMERIKKQQQGSRAGADSKRHEDDSPEARASKRSERRAQDHPTPEEEEERDNPTPQEDQRKAGVKSLVEQGYDENEAEKIMSVALSQNRRVLFVESTPASTSEAIFDVALLKGARVEVILNKGHHAYEGLVEILTGEEVEEATVRELKDRIGRAADNLKMLFAAWARLEAEAKVGEERRQVAKIRNAWGRMADDFLRDD